MATAPTLTPYSSMIARKISGSITAWAWLTACAIDSRPSERIGRIVMADVAAADAAGAEGADMLRILPHRWPNPLGQPAAGGGSWREPRQGVSLTR